jgi:integrase
LQALETYQGERSTLLAIKLTLHTMLRTQEVRFGQWAEVEGLDGPSPLWRVPAERMKARSEHLVPLSRQAVAILQELKSRNGGSAFILQAPTIERVISQNTMIYGLYRLGYHSRATVHGFRGTASTILNENGFNRDWIERQLAHVERNDVRAAYNSAEWLTDRRVMLQWWSDYLDEHSSGLISTFGTLDFGR